MNEQTTKISAAAVASLALGIISLVFLGLFAGIPAVICGHVSLSNIKKNSILTGKGMAIAGLITGYLGITWSLVLFALLILTGQSVHPFIYAVS